MSNASAKVRDSPRTQLALLQSLRAVAAGMIVVRHLGIWQYKYFPQVALLPRELLPCEAGVDLFFVISGFIMMHITPRAHQSWRDQGIFLFRRFARIYPAYWAVAIPLLLLWLWNPNLINNFQGNHVDVSASLLLYPSQYAPVLTVAWTLVCELTYYVIASFVFYFEGFFRMVIIGIWLAVILGANLLHSGVFHDPWIQTFLVGLTLEFIGGMYLAYFLQRGLRRISPIVAAVVVLAAFAMIFVGGVWHDARKQEDLTRVALYGVPSFLIVWMVLQMDIQGEWNWFAKLAPLGDRSYSLYLLHLPVIALVCRMAVLALPHASRVEVFLVLIATVFAIVIPVECLHQFVEKPAHSFCRMLTSRIRPPRRGSVGGAPSA